MTSVATAFFHFIKRHEADQETTFLCIGAILSIYQSRGQKIGGAVPPLPQYALMAWYSVRGSAGTTLPLPYDK
jgi:hypothetical protein